MFEVEDEADVEVDGEGEDEGKVEGEDEGEEGEGEVGFKRVSIVVAVVLVCPDAGIS